MPDQGFTRAVPRSPVPEFFVVERLEVGGGWEVIQGEEGEEEWFLGLGLGGERWVGTGCRFWGSIRPVCLLCG